MAPTLSLYSQAAKRFAGVALVAVLATTSGCVYLRLLDAKAQLADFDRYVRARVEGDLILELTEPTLTHQDIRALGVRPSESSIIDAEETWEVTLEKMLPDDGVDGALQDLHLTFGFDAEHRLDEIRVPAAYLDAFPPEFILETLRAMGASRFNAFKRIVSARWEGNRSNLADVSQEKIAETFGAPNEERSEEGIQYSTYEYTMLRDDGTTKLYWVEFAFDASDGLLKQAKTRSIRIRFDTPS